MSWLRNMKRRLQQMKEDDGHTIDPYENALTGDIENNKKTNFRFPIVSDHEIYGWEKEIVQNEYIKDYLQQESEEEYERVPLHQNERWPGQHVQEGKIHRAAARPESVKPQSYSSSQPASPAVKAALAPTPLAERPKPSRRPFSPTEVPSPIYGYRKSSPILSAMEAAKIKRQQEEAEQLEITQSYAAEMFKKDEILEKTVQLEEQQPSPESIPEALEFPEIHNIIEHEQDNLEVISKEKEEQETEKIAIPSDQKYIQSSSPAAEELLDSPSSSGVATLIEDEQEEIAEEEQLEEALTIEESVEANQEEDLLQPEERNMLQAPVVSEKMLSEEEQTNEIERLPSLSTEQIEAEEQESLHDGQLDENVPEKKEKIVPFNVLMLQSDKQKLLAKNANAKASFIEQAPVQPQFEEAVPVQPAAITTAPMVQQAPEEMVETEEVEEIEDTPPPSYAFPSMRYLAPPEEEIKDEEWLQHQSAKLEEALSYFSIQATVMAAVQGPAVTMFELTVEQGVKVSKIRNLTDDLKLALAARDIRIQAPIPGTSMIGVEIPNRQTRAVRISEVIESASFNSSDSPLEAVLGLSLTGEPQTLDLRKMPHGMIAGATGSGKSVCINSILISLLYKASYHDLKLLLIDPKMVELAPYNGIPHLLSPVITDVKAATAALKWAVEEMERRYELFAHSGVRNIERYNEMVMESRRFSLKMPYMLIVIDELADLMMMAPADVEISISRITQKARACGIHLIIATQRPSVDVITGTIKANIPTRIAFAVSSQVDSRTILDGVGAERLLGKGDMLYLGNGQSSPVRLQGTFVTDDEIERIIEHVRNEAEPDYLFGQEDLLAAAVQEEETDPLFRQACTFVIEQGSASTSSLQRHFSIGYNRAAKLIDRMESNQFISEQRGSKPRDVFLTHQALESFLS
ncbi:MULTISPECIES: DNA translocase FtsK [unclassified Sporosarcina]|uniref:DNA translocase FtsK n=1 Tax=unclassified Sporosarcina TaxID=2647733 RepID=UPI00203D5735|nr:MULTISPECIES: DNA translocase FtsK [unclassified Sporosarcina]